MTTFALGSGFDPTNGAAALAGTAPATSTPALNREPRPAIPAGRVKFVHMRYSLLVTARLRLLVIIGAFALIAMIALLRVGYLGFVGSAPSQTSLAEALLPPRGEITDRNGTPLARTFPAYALWFNPDRKSVV